MLIVTIVAGPEAAGMKPVNFRVVRGLPRHGLSNLPLEPAAPPHATALRSSADHEPDRGSGAAGTSWFDSQ